MPSSERILLRAFLAGALLAGLTLGGVAHAQQSPADRAEAKRVYAEARKVLNEGKLDEALPLFRRAHALAPTPVTRLDLARVLVQQRKLVEARALARSVAELPVSPTETAKSQLARADATSLAAELDLRVGRIELVVASAAGAPLVFATGSVDGATEPIVTLDGAALSPASLSTPLEVDPGEHLVSLRVGETVVEARVSVGEGEHKLVTLTAPSPPAPSRPEPSPPPVEPPPTHTPTPVEPPGFGAPQPPASQGPDVPVPDAGSGPLAPTAGALLGVGVSALVAGAITGGFALSQATDLLAACVEAACPPSQADALSTHEATASAATALFVIGGVVTAAGGVVLLVYATSGDDEPTRPTAVGPRVSLGWQGTGLDLRGTW
jgi:hypothetical protein